VANGCERVFGGAEQIVSVPAQDQYACSNGTTRDSRGWLLLFCWAWWLPPGTKWLAGDTQLTRDHVVVIPPCCPSFIQNPGAAFHSACLTISSSVLRIELRLYVACLVFLPLFGGGGLYLLLGDAWPPCTANHCARSLIPRVRAGGFLGRMRLGMLRFSRGSIIHYPGLILNVADSAIVVGRAFAFS